MVGLREIGDGDGVGINDQYGVLGELGLEIWSYWGACSLFGRVQGYILHGFMYVGKKDTVRPSGQLATGTCHLTACLPACLLQYLRRYCAGTYLIT